MIEIEAIIKIESGGDPKAYNKTTGARGLCQITAICLADWNERMPVKYLLEDLFDPKINVTIARWYLDFRIPALLVHYAMDVSVENVLAAYNFGIGALKSYRDNRRPLPEETQNYITKYKQLTK